MNKSMILVALYCCTIVKAANDLSCSDGHSNNELYPVSEYSCLPYYYECVNGIVHKRDCPPTTVFDPSSLQCDYPGTACFITGCTDADGNSIDGLSFSKASDCSDGIYYTCEHGVETQQQCPSGQIYDSNIQMCWYVENCELNSTPATTTLAVPNTTPAVPGFTSDTVGQGGGQSTATEKPLTSTTTATTTPVTTTTTATTTTAPRDTTTTRSTTLTTTPSTTPAITTTPLTTPTSTMTSPTTTTTASTTSTTTTTTTTNTVAGRKTYVGFVVDDTGSMSVEIIAVKQWIEDCVNGVNANCGDIPTGGWLIVSYNDPDTGEVIGPTLNTDIIIAGIETYYAHGGGDCPEMAMEGLYKLAEKVPVDNGDCKIYIFTDATAKDDYLQDDVTKLFQDKGCRFLPILTGCCGPCPPPCDAVSPEYCEDHVTDYSSPSTRSIRSIDTYSSVQTLFYQMSEETGGNIYITDKPSTSEEMLTFLEEEVTLGFCPSSDIAGPSPNGYECEADCQAMKMCWDKSASTCYCNGTCQFDPIPTGYSRCGGAQHIECDPSVEEAIIPDLYDCMSYYECYYDDLFHFTCANGTIYSQTSPSHCDHEEYVPPPCGTGTVVITP